MKMDKPFERSEDGLDLPETGNLGNGCENGLVRAKMEHPWAIIVF